MSLYEFRNNDIKFKPAEVSILMQFLHTKVGEEALGKETFLQLNQILMSSRALDILYTFRDLKRGTRSFPIEQVK